MYYMEETTAMTMPPPPLSRDNEVEWAQDTDVY